jgi:hypothetical protein
MVSLRSPEYSVRMGLGLAFVLERDIPGVEPERFQGKILASERHALDSIAHDLDLRGLGEFVAFSHAQAEALADDMKFDTPTTGSQSGRWFPPAEARKVVTAVRDYLKNNLDEVMEPEAVLNELDSLSELLEIAETHRVGFRLSVDY